MNKKTREEANSFCKRKLPSHFRKGSLHFSVNDFSNFFVKVWHYQDVDQTSIFTLFCQFLIKAVEILTRGLKTCWLGFWLHFKSNSFAIFCRFQLSFVRKNSFLPRSQICWNFLNRLRNEFAHKPNKFGQKSHFLAIPGVSVYSAKKILIVSKWLFF